MLQSITPDRMGFFFYRLGTVLKSFNALRKLPQQKVDAFMNSYNIYNHDWVNEEDLIRDMGPDYYAEVQKKLVDYYSVLNHLCAIGQVEKMYIPPAMDLSKSIIENQNLFERRMAKDLGLQPGNKALDIGCGRGRIASHMATVTGAHVTGVNIDLDQLDSAKRFIRAHKLEQQCHFQRGDLNDLPFPFPENHFDGIYQVQVFSLAKSLPKLFAEVYRMLKPGGKFACLDWMSLDAYDASNPHHANLMKRIKPLIGAIGTPSVHTYAEALRSAGFKILVNENASIDGLQAPLIDKADRFYTGLSRWVYRLTEWKVLPAHFRVLFDRLTRDGQAFVEADRMRLVTTSHYIVAQK
ncbi:MAG: methyltransferase domain-containing protein [Verrucomicrobiota bacterium]|nr:methyltransferase domain-containing protein [Verrucomicrobiota bacterium]